MSRALFLTLLLIAAPATWAQQKPKAVMGAPKTAQTESKQTDATQSDGAQPSDRHQVLLVNDDADKAILLRNQGQSSFCFAVTATAMFDAWNRAHAKHPEDYQRSSSAEVAKAKSRPGPYGGGDPSQALDYLFARGACIDDLTSPVECIGGKKHGALEKEVGSNCIRNRMQTTAHQTVLRKGQPGFENSMAAIDGALDGNMPALVSICLQDKCDPKKSEYHASLVIGRECDTQKRGFGCHYLVHVMYGTDLTDIDLGPNFGDKKRQEAGLGAIWMSEDELKQHLDQVITLK